MPIISTTISTGEKAIKSTGNVFLGILEGMAKHAKPISSNVFASVENLTKVSRDKTEQLAIESGHELKASKSIENEQMTKDLYLADRKNELQSKQAENLETSIAIGNKLAELKGTVRESVVSEGVLDYDAMRADIMRELIAEERAKMKAEILAEAKKQQVNKEGGQ